MIYIKPAISVTILYVYANLHLRVCSQRTQPEPATLGVWATFSRHTWLHISCQYKAATCLLALIPIFCGDMRLTGPHVATTHTEAGIAGEFMPYGLNLLSKGNGNWKTNSPLLSHGPLWSTAITRSLKEGPLKVNSWLGLIINGAISVTVACPVLSSFSPFSF